jgi:hypothetical protein
LRAQEHPRPFLFLFTLKPSQKSMNKTKWFSSAENG